MITRFRHLLFSKPVANTGSQLRDHQANERTFLSWTRMGLAFAAMALALGRLGMIDQVFHNIHLVNNNHLNNQLKIEHPVEKSTTATSSEIGKDQQHPDHTTGHQVGATHASNRHELLASQACWAISVWSFGYGAFRYVSVHRNLLQGRFVPAVWGPVLMTCGSLGSLAAMLQMDYGRLRHGEEKKE